MNISCDNAMYTTIAEEFDEENLMCDLKNCKDCTFDCPLNPHLKHIYGDGKDE